MAKLLIAKRGGDTLVDQEKDLAFTSDRSCLIEMFSLLTTLTTDVDGNGSLEITHNLGYVPSVFVFEKGYLDTTFWYPQYVMGVRADTTKLYITATYLDSNTTYQIFYSISGNRNDNVVGSGNNNVSGRLRIAKSGYDAETEQDVRNMRFMSGKSVWKVDSNLSGNVQSTPDGSGYTLITIPHNLGYVPMCFVLCTDNGGMLPYTVPLYGGLFMLHHIDNNNLYIEVYNASTATVNFKYKILRDKIA